MENRYISEELDEWVEIQSPSPSNRAQLNKNVDSVIKSSDGLFSDSEVFPPSNHEGLPLASPNVNQLTEVQQQFSSSFSSSSLASDGSDTNRESEDEEIKDKSVGRINLGLESLRYRFVAVASRMRNYAASKGRILWLVTSVTTGLGALLFVILLYLKIQRRHRQVKLERKQHLKLLIKEKDQKITELLFQISRLNDALFQRRRVPVLQIG